MSKRVALVLAAPLLVLLASCGVEAGRVEAKEFHPAYVLTTLMPTSCGPNCFSTIPVPQYFPECYEVRLKNENETGSHCIAEPEWNTVEVGQWWEVVS